MILGTSNFFLNLCRHEGNFSLFFAHFRREDEIFFRFIKVKNLYVDWRPRNSATNIDTCGSGFRGLKFCLKTLLDHLFEW
jgi:hypothetical protein